MKLCIFCSANQNIDPEFFESAQELGEWAAKNGHSIVFGGHDAGLMHTVSYAAKAAGGQVSVEDLMMAQGDAFIVLPGGIGTLDELFTVAAAGTLQYHEKPLILWNMKDFWNSLIACLDDLQQKGVIRGDWRSMIKVANDLDDVVRLLS